MCAGCLIADSGQIFNWPHGALPLPMRGGRGASPANRTYVSAPTFSVYVAELDGQSVKKLSFLPARDGSRLADMYG